MKPCPITQARLKELFSYDPETGAFTRLKRVATSTRIGEVAGCVNLANRYVYITISKRSYLAHRLAWLYMTGDWPAQQIDHLDGERANNRWSNLRQVTNKVNGQNQRRARVDNKSCGLLGVRRNHHRWQAGIQVDGKRINLGMFATPEEAHAAYVNAKRVLHEGCTL